MSPLIRSNGTENLRFFCGLTPVGKEEIPSGFLHYRLVVPYLVSPALVNTDLSSLFLHAKIIYLIGTF